VNLEFINLYIIYLRAALFVCVWRWSCELSHGSRWYSRWCWWCI